ncbi:MAG: TMEM143 family protein, partial [Desulfobacterales bacterium]
FEEVLFYQRGESTKKETLVKFFGLKKEPITFTNYERVVIYIKFKKKDYFNAKKQKNLYFTPGSTIIKLFQNVPKADLEMLFPNSEVRMKTVDKLIIGVPAAVSGIVLTATKLGGTILLIASVISFWLGLTQKEIKIDQQHLIALALGLATLGGFLFKQINKFKNRKIKFMKALSDNLYFKNLDNNTGVFHHLVDTAEEEEFKEAILAYYFLLIEDRDLTITQLDEIVERWFETKHNCRINFEIEDALQKLERWNLVNRDRNIIRRKNMNDAMQQLDKIWDNYFPYHQAG